ncbi:Fibronectin-binding protein [Lacticaseibacillus pantheris DSM 15945 = JCM 12539 = NBRC 106106]|uniref:Rqc2 homolog RqcH n=1 Tax=Lacticaseibacillus pantheris DSM 15945 = JCM 12539 = NBRC 106106 TaxID=1423783 RepID=A0A0R1U3H1_9LACO|nr:NFACT RNA binding domain-containing protein [Lacticaseibacillus pantheris]KRL85461.1 Fibronectin-binding protein [Lacticaseibacillus pantheris DSM 15945 = JCM 12539 = NBRC 106106]
MSFDGLFTHAMVRELQGELQSGRVMKISQPYPYELMLSIRANRKTQTLLLSANPELARVQITTIPFANPKVPTPFTMAMRKYLAAATLTDIQQVGADRIIYFDFATRDELGDSVSLRLVVELMGRHSNVILVDQRTHKILELIRHVHPDENRFRILLPGAEYVDPPYQDKLDPFTAQPADYTPLVEQAGSDTGALAKAIQSRFQGFGRDAAVEMATRLQHGLPQAAWDGLIDAFNHPEPVLIDAQKPQFAATPLRTVDGDAHAYPTLSALLDAFYAQRAERARVQEVGSKLIRVLRTNTERLTKKLKKLQHTLDESDRADELRIRGEVLTTYLRDVPRGANSVELPNFYDDMRPIKIALAPELGPNQNAQKYFTRYQKLRKAVSHVHEQMAEAQAELEYLQGVQAMVEIAAPQDLVDIQTELTNAGYIRLQRKAKKQRQPKVAPPERFWASDGTAILVGKNNLQNEQLTLHSAAKDDVWLHAKDIPGSHVIVKSNDPSARTLTEAASLAAYFSKARQSANVPVDYIPVKRIRKPNGSKPGFVIYTGQRTLSVTPTTELVDKLRQQPTM